MAELKEYVTSLEDEKAQLTAQVMSHNQEVESWRSRLQQCQQGDSH